ncbi:similar to Saccharomyces cerevisiae YML011C RAD33 Protein involved in nucleotide excision repair [Maudiozyma saulgeensis]|uniref:Similar to Saccharomyces cerevisiae YML011C RAD33 Protein involved in nucleotide excision repair n=1 Tax=Maudiozyma saulgeensis TaxID=1789683 RepID=A0A1X7QWU7_9SACH|nr:similar to Saccharomyces cerevisiae YML011C RAD33 Protein involved in nucleotide excision repair [Kazachstania saulgeensis]
MSDRLSYEKVSQFANVKVPQDIEDEMLNVYATYSIEHDMNTNDLEPYFKDLELPKDLYKLIRKEDLVIEGTNIIDFQLLIRSTYHILIYIDNGDVIKNLWTTMIKNSGRDVQFPNTKLTDHVLSVKDLQKISNVIGVSDQSGLIQMMSCATEGNRLFITYLDFASVLGKLGLLRYRKA